MATPNPSRAVDTLRLSQFQRQFFQWYYLDKMSLTQVKTHFDLLFASIRQDCDIEMQVSKGQWRYRLKKWKVDWFPKSVRRDEDVVMPEHLKEFKLWYEEQHSVQNYLTCMIQPCDRCALEVDHGQFPQHSTVVPSELALGQRSEDVYPVVTAPASRENVQTLSYPQMAALCPGPPSYTDTWDPSDSHSSIFNLTPSASQCASPVYHNGYLTSLLPVAASGNERNAVAYTPASNGVGEIHPGYLDFDYSVHPPAPAPLHVRSNNCSVSGNPELDKTPGARNDPDMTCSAFQDEDLDSAFL